MSNRLRDLFGSPSVRIDPTTGEVIDAQVVMPGDMPIYAIDGSVGSSMPEDGREALDAIEAMSQLNRADMPENRPTGEPMPPWMRALERLTKPYPMMDARPRRSFIESPSDGDRPADLTDKEIADAATWGPEYRNRCRTREGRALVWREMIYDRGRGGGHSLAVRETHSAVHRTLSDDATTGPTIGGCPWCKEASR